MYNRVRLLRYRILLAATGQYWPYQAHYRHGLLLNISRWINNTKVHHCNIEQSWPEGSDTFEHVRRSSYCREIFDRYRFHLRPFPNKQQRQTIIFLICPYCAVKFNPFSLIESFQWAYCIIHNLNQKVHRNYAIHLEQARPQSIIMSPQCK